jgi:hypothetical protein
MHHAKGGMIVIGPMMLPTTTSTTMAMKSKSLHHPIGGTKDGKTAGGIGTLANPGGTKQAATLCIKMASRLGFQPRH